MDNAWISVEERLPPKGEDVQLYTEISDGQHEQLVGFRIDDERFQFAFFKGVAICCIPTHWMPLPAPPLSRDQGPSERVLSSG